MPHQQVSPTAAGLLKQDSAIVGLYCHAREPDSRLALKGSLQQRCCHGRLLCGTIGRREAARPTVLTHGRPLEEQ